MEEGYHAGVQVVEVDQIVQFGSINLGFTNRLHGNDSGIEILTDDSVEEHD